MKTLEEYMKMPHRIVVVPDKEEGGYTVYYPELPGCATCVETMEEIDEAAADAKREWLKAAIDSNIQICEPQEDFSGQLRVRMPKSLHRNLALMAADEGVSLNQFIVYQLGKAVGAG